MRVTVDEVTNAVLGLLNKTRTREEVSTWASTIRAADDVEKTKYVPANAEKSIWDALEFLMGFDMKSSPTSYLYSDRDLEKYWEDNKGGLAV